MSIAMSGLIWLLKLELKLNSRFVLVIMKNIFEMNADYLTEFQFDISQLI